MKLIITNYQVIEQHQLFMKKWSSPHYRLSCCWSPSAPCCTCTSRTSPRIGHVWTNLLGLWVRFCFSSSLIKPGFVFVLFLCLFVPPWCCGRPWKDPCTSLQGAGTCPSCCPQPEERQRWWRQQKETKNCPKEGWTVNTEQNRPDSTSSRHSSKSGGLRSTLAPASSG